MKTSAGVAAVVALEDAAPDAMFERVPGTDERLWPLLRWPMARTTQEVEFETILVPVRRSRAQVYTDLLRRAAPSRYSSAALRRQADALFVVNGNTVRRSPAGSRNWLIEDFAESLGQRAAVLQDEFFDRWTPRSERPTFPRTATYADALNRIQVRARLDGLPPGGDEQIARATRDLFQRLDFPVGEDAIAEAIRKVAYRARRVRSGLELFGRIIDRVSPTLVVMQGAAYGDRSHLIRLLRSRGITVAEPQHGWIGPYHGAYNFGAAMSTTDLAETLPGTLLTFGDFWSSNVRFPGEIVSIGKPHLELQRQENAAQLRDEVLVISGVSERARLTAFTLDQRAALPESWAVRFRPHPSERLEFASLYPELVDRPGIEIDLTADVMTSLATARSVVGLSSTVLYEALAFGCQVFVLDSPLADYGTDESVFGRRILVDDVPADVARRITSGRGAAASSATLDSVWHPDARETFRAWAESRLGG